MKSRKIGLDGNMIRLLVILAIVVLIAGVTRPTLFLQPGNFQSIGKQLAEYGLMALGIGICMISGGIDLSVVYIANLCGISAGLLMQKMSIAERDNPGRLFLVIMAAMVIGALCGIVNGLLVSKLHIPAMLATLGTYQLFMGIAVVITGGSTVSGMPEGYTAMGTMLIAGIPLAFLIFLCIVCILSFIMHKTTYGTRVYLVGTNPKSAHFAGIHNSSILIRTYMISGIVAAAAGLVSLARINSAKADFGSSYTMQCILIVVLGGVNPNGGFGKVSGVAVAVLILQVISSYLNMFPDISNFFRDLIWGVALIIVLIMNHTISERRTAKLAKMI